MPLSAFCLALGAAFMHATWNVLLAGSRDSEASTAVATLCGVVLLAPVALVTGGVTDAALPFAAASAALHVAYLALLARAYQDGQVSVVYPVSRGTAPVLVLVVRRRRARRGSDRRPGRRRDRVSAGVFLVGARRSDPEARMTSAATCSSARAIALTIAAYTLVDAEGVDRAQAPAYLFLLLAPSSVIYAAALAAGGARPADALRARPARVPDRRLHRRRLRLGARGAPARRRRAGGRGAASRASSIAALLSAVVLHERVDARRFAGAALVVLGVAAIAYS